MTDLEKIEFIKEAILKLFNKEIKIIPSSSLLDLGLDSLDIVELQIYYEDITGNETNPDVTIKTVGDLMNLMT